MAWELPEIRIVNLGIDLSRTFLQLTQNVVDTVLGGSIGVLDSIESKLPDIPLVSRPQVGAGATRMALPPGRMRALPPGRPAGYSVPMQVGPQVVSQGAVIEI